MGYDIIGDIHGYAGALRALLRKMGYQERQGVWQHPGRQAIFVGDLVDRGPEQLETIQIARGMVESGAALAVMGNHEFNALAWDTEDHDRPGEYLRPHNDKNHRQHQVFLAATRDKPDERRSILNWFMELPLWLELPGLRAVHACWHPKYMEFLKPKLKPGNRIDTELLRAASRRGSPEHQAIEAILKGPEVKLPNGVEFRTGDDLRKEARTRWWDADAVTLRQTAMVDSKTAPMLPDVPVSPELRFGYAGDRPVFFGHYWMKGTPKLLAPRVACLDYSVGHGEPLVAYRWDGEQDLDEKHFVTTE
ncbi:MAG TPA: metallophosphoesterase [Rhodanobacteraceae bacterium]|nr:metallophosphoesterase [Rhodanobacteraceae bacterium]